MPNRTGKIKKCLACGKEYYVPVWRLGKSKFCSRDCQNHTQYKSLKKICNGCGKEFLVSNSRSKQKFCGEGCRTLKSKDVVYHRKQSKICSAQSRGWRSKYLRKQVLQEHNNKCDICGFNDYDYCLDVHHLDMNPKNNERNNLGLLCVICHRKLHKGDLKYAINS